MLLKKLSLTHFRNIEQCVVEFDKPLTICYGANGSGKTSLMEAIHYLAYNKSFRTNNVRNVIQNDRDFFSIQADIITPRQHQHCTLSLIRDRKCQTRIKKNDVPIEKTAELVRMCPIKMIDSMCYNLLQTGPQSRRKFLDWGVFHDTPSFGAVWGQLNKALKQRNALLKTAFSHEQILYWESIIAQSSEQVHQARQAYIDALNAHFETIIQTTFPTMPEFRLEYLKGWADETDLLQKLQQSRPHDRLIGHTQQGAQKADLKFLYQGKAAKEILSQGQQKLLAYSLHLSQGFCLQSRQSIAPAYLIDDLCSELDADNANKMLELLSNMDAQVILSAIDPDDLLKAGIHNHQVDRFYIEKGVIQPDTEMILINESAK